MASVARQVRDQIKRGGTRLWRVEDFDGPPSAVNNALRRLVAQDELTRVRRGVYWHGRKSRFGMIGAAQSDIVRRVVGSEEAIGAAGWHAANLLGLSTQVAPVEAIAVTHRLPEGLGKVKLYSRAARSARRVAKLNPLEVTFLEALDGWDRYVEADAPTALMRFSDLLGSDEIRVERLVRASPTEPPAVRERLRAVLRYAGFEAQAEEVSAARDSRTRKRALEVMGAHA